MSCFTPHSRFHAFPLQFVLRNAITLWIDEATYAMTWWLVCRNGKLLGVCARDRKLLSCEYVIANTLHSTSADDSSGSAAVTCGCGSDRCHDGRLLMVLGPDTEKQQQRRRGPPPQHFTLKSGSSHYDGVTRLLVAFLNSMHLMLYSRNKTKRAQWNWTDLLRVSKTSTRSGAGCPFLLAFFNLAHLTI